MDKQRITGSIFGHLKKAFDLADHHCLLHKLEHYEIRGKILKLFEDYLTTRTQKVKYNQDVSSSLTIGYGVPQWSILCPILFVVYINDLPQSLLESSIGIHADDTVIYYSDSPETFRARKAIFRSSVSKNREVYTPGTPCMKRTSVYINIMWI